MLTSDTFQNIQTKLKLSSRKSLHQLSEETSVSKMSDFGVVKILKHCLYRISALHSFQPAGLVLRINFLIGFSEIFTMVVLTLILPSDHHHIMEETWFHPSNH
jgi:hypothetical protein